ncbi:MAG: peptidyl-prolyl cis-trans isomerase [Bacteroidetes bacterium]|nr:peptidyl-prolyl cis-trans isomerase [Bacteroidota bacterium]
MLWLFAAGCTQTEPAGTVVARVNESVLTMEQVRADSDPSRPLSQNEVRQYANRWVVNELLFQEAASRGYDESEQLLAKVREAKKQLTIAELLEREVYSVAENAIQPSRIATYYQAHAAEFVLQEDIVRLSVAVFAEMEPANRFRASVLGGTGWDAGVAAAAGDQANGLISYTDSTFYSSSSLYPPELWKVAGALGMLEVSFPVKTSVGYVVMRSLGQFRSGAAAPIAYVEPQIRGRLVMELRQERYQQYIQSLRAKHSVQMMVAVQDTLSGER